MSFETPQEYANLQVEFEDLGLPTNSSDGISIWIGNLYTLNSGNLPTVGGWVGLPLDESAFDEMMDVIGADGSEYIIADVNAPYNMATQLSNMTAKDINLIADTMSMFGPTQQQTFGAAMAIPDIANYHDPLRIAEGVEDGEIYYIQEDELDAYLEEWIPMYYSYDDLLQQYLYSGNNRSMLMFELYNNFKAFKSYKVGFDYIVMPVDFK